MAQVALTSSMSAFKIHRGVPMPSYRTYTCPSCESSFRVVFPDPVPSHYANQSKIKTEVLDVRGSAGALRLSAHQNHASP